MADIVADGRTRVAWLGSIANMALVTIAELNAGLLLQNFVTADGLTGLQGETTTIPTTSLASRTNTSRNGRVNFDQAMITFKKQDGTDTVYNTLVRDLNGFLVVRNSILETVNWASAQSLRVYPMQCGEISWMDPEENSLERYMIPMTITGDPNQRAAVA
jgi:hypothetical protein